MDKELLVDSHINDGEKLLAELVRSDFDVTVAFWALTSEESSWFLYIGSTVIEPGTIGDAYGRLYVSLSKVPNVSLSLSDVKLVHPSNPIARDAIVERDRRPGRIPVRYRGKRLGDLAIEEAYIYPKVGPMTRDDVRQTVMALLDRSGQTQSSTFTLADGSTRLAISIGMHLSLAGPKRGLQFDLLDPVTNQHQVVAADDVINIQ